jgi:hypothetical protein
MAHRQTPSILLYHLAKKASLPYIHHAFILAVQRVGRNVTVGVSKRLVSLFFLLENSTD